MTIMDQTTKAGTQAESTTIQVLKLLAAFGLMAALMYYMYTYPYPDGQPPSLWSFALFWLRELVMMFFVVIVVAVSVVGWIIKVILQRIRRHDETRHTGR
jgi:hypothetical protein